MIRGATGIVELYWDGPATTFRNLQQENMQL
jgi:hypothetical protein